MLGKQASPEEESDDGMSVSDNSGVMSAHSSDFVSTSLPARESIVLAAERSV